MMACGRKLGPYDCCTVVCGDCLQLMRELPDGCVDAVITDPPYGVGFSRYDLHNDSEQMYPQLIKDILHSERLVMNGWMGVFQTEKNANSWSEWFTSPWRLMALPKTFGQIGRERISRQTDYVLYGPVGSPVWPPIGAEAPEFYRNWYVSREASATANRPDHPCPRPIDMMLYLCSCFGAPGTIILDPFLGSGTTAVAAKKLGRHFLGFEISPEYCRIAEERIALVEMQPGLFEKKPEQLVLA